MPNIKSAMKRDEKSKLQNLKNKAEKSALKTNLKKFDAAVAEGNRDAAVSTYKVAVQAVTARPARVSSTRTTQRTRSLRWLRK